PPAVRTNYSFQAEDGIREFHVTGVQTCALPISALAAAVQAIREGREQEGVVFAVDPSTFSQVPRSPFAYWASDRIRRLFSDLPSSEARRVGKACTSGRSSRLLWRAKCPATRVHS